MRWYLKPESPWRVRVLDKTVPHPDYREHAALFWVLRHEKAATPQGARNWDLRRDYVGYYPVVNDGEQRGQGRELRAEDLAATDLLYLADAYGVAPWAPYWAEGLPSLNKSMLRIWFPRGADQEPFYWGFYIPLLRNLLTRYDP